MPSIEDVVEKRQRPEATPEREPRHVHLTSLYRGGDEDASR